MQLTGLLFGKGLIAMTDCDFAFVSRVLNAGLITGKVLELGTGYDGPICKPLILGAGLEYIGSDSFASRNVDVIADIESRDQIDRFKNYMPFGSILLLNVLEHTFDPIGVLDNLISILKPGGMLINIAPAIWPIHDFPCDAWRILPNFYEEYAKRRGLFLKSEFFEYISYGKVVDHKNNDGTYRFPVPGKSVSHNWYSRVIHKLFNTSGRGMINPSYVCIGCVFQVPENYKIK